MAEAISDLFAERGFDAVSVEEAAREVGISRATFFRYFDSKEDAIFATLEGRTADLAGVLRDLPSREGDSAWVLVHRMLREVLSGVDTAPDLDRARLRMIHTTPALRARLVQRRFAREADLSRALTDRGADRALAQTVVIAALSVLDLVWWRWASGEAASLSAALDECFDHLADATRALD